MHALYVYLVACFLFHILATTVVAQDTSYINNQYLCNTTLRYTSNSTYAANLNGTLDLLTANAWGNDGFYSTTSGQNTSDQVYGLLQCRGDVSPERCRTCGNDLSSLTLERCQYQKEALAFSENCTLRYAYYNFSSVVASNDLDASIYNPNNVYNPDLFGERLQALMRNLSLTASSNSMRFSTGKTLFSGLVHVFGLAQCTRDLSESNCSSCLHNLTTYTRSCCEGKQGARLFSKSCFVRYEITQFFLSPALVVEYQPAPAPPPFVAAPPGSTGKGSRGTLISILASVSGVMVVIFLGICYWFARNRVKKGKKARREAVLFTQLGRESNIDLNGNSEGSSDVKAQEIPLIPFDVIQEATNNFCIGSKLGQGGFGPVYKGTLHDGKEIAVKRLSERSQQGLREFKTEVQYLSRLQHRNLVRLLGYCIEGSEKLLIYEYLPNSSLDVYIFDPTRQAQVNWKSRYNIINGIAKGLLYLHEDSRLKVVHRDLKASNILLDHEMNSKISDFGLAIIFGDKQIQAIAKRVVGTVGYIAPEYRREGQYSVKSDVFSFGVILLEIISGKKNNNFHLLEDETESLLTYAWGLWYEGRGLELVDPLLGKSCETSEVLKCIHVALLCVQYHPADRPTMSSVVFTLHGNTINLVQPSKPGYTEGQVVSEKSSINDITISNLLPR